MYSNPVFCVHLWKLCVHRRGFLHAPLEIVRAVTQHFEFVPGKCLHTEPPFAYVPGNCASTGTQQFVCVLEIVCLQGRISACLPGKCACTGTTRFACVLRTFAVTGTQFLRASLGIVRAHVRPFLHGSLEIVRVHGRTIFRAHLEIVRDQTLFFLCASLEIVRALGTRFFLVSL
jgi:hypothetical protein